MYDQFYRLNAEPFRLSPDHAFAYTHKGYIKARAYMAYAFMRQEGFVMITGRPGTGKTTLIGALVEHLSKENARVANLVCSQLKADDLLKMVAYEFGIPVTIVEKGELLQRLTQQLRSWHRDGQRALLIVDEAQDLAMSAMEELRLLTNIQINGKPLLQIFLLGQPELRELVLRPEMEQVHQRIVAASHLKPLEEEETQAYILHRLEVVGWRGDPAFSQAVFPLVHKFSEGIPRRINLICSRLLLHCSLDERHRVTVDDVREVVTELQDESLAVGSGWSESDFQLAANKDIDVVPRDTEASAYAEPGSEEPSSGQRTVEADVGRPRSQPQAAVAEPPQGASGSADSEEGAARARQHLKVVAPVQRRTGTDGLAPGTSQAAPTETGSVVLESEQEPMAAATSPGGRPVAARTAPAAERAKEPSATPAPAAPARKQARSSGAGRPDREKPGRERTSSDGRGEAPVRPRPEQVGARQVKPGRARDSSGAWAILVILVLSAALVAWAATGFSLEFLGK